MDNDRFIPQLIGKLARRKDLSLEETSILMRRFVDNEFTHAQLGCIIMGMRLKRETPEELSGFLKVFRGEQTTVPKAEVPARLSR